MSDACVCVCLNLISINVYCCCFISSIALHHLIRKPGNRYSDQILAFDLKIRRGDQLTGEEKKLYVWLNNYKSLYGSKLLLLGCWKLFGHNFIKMKI